MYMCVLFIGNFWKQKLNPRNCLFIKIILNQFVVFIVSVSLNDDGGGLVHMNKADYISPILSDFSNPTHKPH